MIPSNLAYDYVKDIPWNENPAFAFSDDSQAYLDAFHSVIHKVPEENCLVSFHEDVWDFNPYFVDSNSKHLRFDFSKVPSELKENFKFFVLHKAMGRTKISTINVRVTNAMSILNHVTGETAHTSISLVTTEDIIAEIKGRNASPSTTHNLYEGAYQFYYFLESNYHMQLPVDIAALKRLGILEKELTKKEDSKLPDIPEDYFNRILEKAESIMRDTSADYNERATACMIVILSQTGLRVGDLMCLRTDQLFSRSLPKSGLTADYIHYKTHKPSKPHDDMLEFDIFCNQLCSEAWGILKQLRNNCQFASEPYLYVLDSGYGTKDAYPLPNHRFRKEFKKFLHKRLPLESSMEWPGISMDIFTIGSGRTKQKFILAVPDSRQFRVHLCTALYNRGIPLVYIQKYMGHLSEYMLGYYVRPKDTYQENIAYSEKIIREIAGEDITPIGPMGESLRANIKQFVANNGLDVHKDVHAVIKALGEKLVIRGKTGGVCIKTSLMPCSKDARTNEILCAYGLCHNLFHFYYMADMSYLDFLTLQAAYQENISNGHSRAAQKELGKIRDLLCRRLVPELEELDKEIAAKGTNHVVSRDPFLRDIVANLDAIREEASKWMQMH